MIRPLSRQLLPHAHSRALITTSAPFCRANHHDSLAPVVRDMLKSRVGSVDHKTCQPGEEDAFFVADLGQISHQHELWCSNLPRVKAHYAIKCNPDTEVIRHLAKLGVGFDCASKSELRQVLDVGVDPGDIVYANCAKAESAIRYASSKGVTLMTFDNVDELHKIKRSCAHAALLLRITTDDRSALSPLSSKFGASLDVTNELLNVAKDLDLNVVGVSFHIGSNARDSNVFALAIEDARKVFDQAASKDLKLTILDIGGGFSKTAFSEMASVIRKALSRFFPSRDLNIIGEPGRFYVESAFTLACHIIARSGSNMSATEQSKYKLYLNDGLYGNLSGILLDNQNPQAKVLRNGLIYLPTGESGRMRKKPIQYSLWGPTCDGFDRITKECYFNEVLDAGDWLYFENMGAYTRCTSTRFNSFSVDHDVYYVSSKAS